MHFTRILQQESSLQLSTEFGSIKKPGTKGEQSRTVYGRHRQSDQTTKSQSHRYIFEQLDTLSFLQAEFRNVEESIRGSSLQ